MKYIDITSTSQDNLMEIDSALTNMMSDLSKTALEGIAEVLSYIDSGYMTLNKRFGTKKFYDIYLIDGRVKVTYETCKDEGRAEFLENFGPWYIVRIAIRVFNAWSIMVERGLLNNDKKKKERHHGI